jgi:hypothetical protein
MTTEDIVTLYQKSNQQKEVLIKRVRLSNQPFFIAYFYASLAMLNSFKKSIPTGGYNLTFHFNRIYAVDGIHYHISVRSIFNITNYIMMQKKNEGWYFSDITVLPQWIIELERKLEAAIEESL